MPKTTIEGFRLSPLQRRLWQLQETEGASTFRAQCAVCIQGRLDVEVLWSALQEVVKRHEILRTTFQPLPHLDAPLQRIGMARDFDRTRLAFNGESSMREDGDARLNPAAQIRFDFQEGPLFLPSLIEIGPSERLLAITLPSMCADEASLGVLVDEISHLYAARLDGRDQDGEVLQYADAAELQNELLESEESQAGRVYWREREFQSLLGVRLPFERKPGGGSFQPAFIEESLSSGVVEKIRRLTHERGVSISSFLLACWQITLCKMSGSSKAVVGVGYDGRTYDEMERALGRYARYLPVTCQLSPRSPFLSLLMKVEDDVSEAREWQDYFSWEQVYENGGAELPYFPFCYDFREQPASVEAGAITFSLKDIYVCADKFKLRLSCVERTEGLVFEWRYDARFFSPDDVRRVAASFKAIVEAAVESPSAPLIRLPLMSQKELRRVVVDWNDTAKEYPRWEPFHRQFEAQVRHTPQAIAVSGAHDDITYDELNRGANRLADRLRHMGVSAESRVGVLVEHGPELIIAALGVLKAGGAYVPLDEQYPPERLRWMLNDAQARVLVTQSRFLTNLTGLQAPVLCLDDDRESIQRMSSENLPDGARSENLAYVLYTSGSTGQPKGVMIEHRSLVNYMSWVIERIFDESVGALPAVTKLTFDASLKQLLGPLLRGQAVWMGPRRSANDPAALWEAINSRSRVGLNCVPSLWQAMVEAAESRQAIVSDALKRLYVGGEQVGQDLLKRTWDLLPELEIWNLYGPTEATANASAGRIASSENINIGRPISNTQIYLLDQELSPVPVGAPGELFIGGDGLARGYLNRPDLTADRFIPNPFGSVPGSRLYRTDDLARFSPDGKTEFLGRGDQQVKIRGFRIELGEIENVLAAHPLIREALVTVREDAPGAKRLVGYVTARNGAALSVAELRHYLKAQLPEYMIPTAFALLESLPLLPNGKLDRESLPQPELYDAESGQAFVAPRTPTEEKLAGIWASLLRVERIGVHDNFFEIGGHSLLATQLFSRIRGTLRVEVPLRQIFETPTIAGLAEVVESSSRTLDASRRPPLTPVRRDQPLPLSFAQQRLWFLDKLEPGDASYNIPTAVRLEGDINIESLVRALSEVVRRHEVLRTTFAEAGGQPVQFVHEAGVIDLPVIDLHQHGYMRDVEIRRLIDEEAGRPFNLSAGPLLRAKLLTLGDCEHVLLLTMHHIVSDGWSHGVLVNEVAQLYDAFTRGEPSPLRDLQIQYADYAVWQRNWLQGSELETQLGYWREKLADAPPAAELPSDRPRLASPTRRGAHHLLHVSAELLESLNALGQREGATLFMTLLAAWQALLHRYTGEHDICVGSPIANRNNSETENLIGFFVNTLVLRVRVEGRQSFRELLREARETCLGAYAHQDVPFERLVEDLQPTRHLGRTPFFQCMFVVQNAPRPELRLSGLTLSSIEVGYPTVPLDLTVSAAETANGMTVTFAYDTDLFGAGTIARMAGHFQAALEAMAADVETIVAEFKLLSDKEHHAIVDSSRAEQERAEVECIHMLFEARAERAPDVVAVESETEEVSYAELNRRANQFARQLRKLGVGPDDRVAVFVERSVGMTVAVLGILKAGGAYLPIDTGCPKERFQWIIENAGVQALVTQHSLLGALPECEVPALCLDADWPTISLNHDKDLDIQVTGANAAYVIYTSGSTGRPKGVIAPHRAVVEHCHSTADAYQLKSEDKVLQFASLSFDVSAEEMFPTWACGGSVILRPERVLDHHEALLEFLARERITVVDLPTAYWSDVVEEMARKPWLREPLSLRLARVGGEKASPERFALSKRVLGEGVRLVNIYGPTETTITNTIYDYPDAVSEDLRMAVTVPIGRPMPDTRIYILDSYLNLVPIGVKGEIYIGGYGVARGYLGQPELTAERFIPDRFSPSAGDRLYKTGDLARYLHNGEIEFLGRVDQQVKIRGFRVEVGEIESALVSFPGILDARVIPIEGPSGQTKLVAYVAPEAASDECRTNNPERQLAAGEAPTDKESPSSSRSVREIEAAKRVSKTILRSYLGLRLPDYMIPASFVYLNNLPLTERGKLDSRALPAAKAGLTESEHLFIPPRTPVELALASIWQELLGAKRIGARDNFFELGGHSLLATRMISRLRELFAVELPLRHIFENPTLSACAAGVEARLRDEDHPTAPPIKPVERGVELPLSFAQERLWFLERLEPNTSRYNMPVAVRLRGPLNYDALERSINEIIRRHESLRTTFGETDGRPSQTIAAQQIVCIAAEDYTTAPKQEVEETIARLITEEARRPFDLSVGPLLRVRMFALGADDHILTLVMSHIVSDAWSLGVLTQEITALYEAFSIGAESPLEELPAQYAEYAAWQREYLQGAALERQLAYWRNQLADAPAALQLPTDRPRPAVSSNRGGQLSFTLPAALTEELHKLSRNEGVTIFMTLLSAFLTLLHRYSGQEDISVGAPVANRNRAETENIIGFFVNTLVLRVDLAGDPAFSELLGRVKEVCLGAYSHQDLPFERLVEELQPERNLGRTPLFQVMFVLQNAPFAESALPGLSLGPVQIASGAAKFDLILAIEESAEKMQCELQYDPDLFDEGSVDRMAGHFQTILDGIVAEPGERLSRLPLLRETERRWLLAQCEGAVQQRYKTEKLIHELFEEQVERTPDRPALIFNDWELTYQELNRRANRLARRLRSLGAGAEVPVAVFAERSVELMTALLAILKTGSLYVPLDPAYPSERIEFVLDDAKAAIVLADSRTAVSLPRSAKRIVYLDDPSAFTYESEKSLDIEIDPRNLAYLIYTSGSTGRPKGVAIKHGSAAALVQWAGQVFSSEELDGVLAATSICFDLSVFELFVPLCLGGKVILAENALELPSLAAVNQVRLINTVPSAMAELVRLNAISSSVRTVNLAGEALQSRLVEQVYNSAKVRKVYNLYGPSEDTTYSTFALITADRDGAPPIGRPISNTQAYILDRRLQLVPVGVIGELCIGGAGLARGYLARPDLTAEYFIPDPFSDRPGQRLYLTGDLASFASDGNITFVGRADHQIKLRGYRIELGEIESMIGEHEDVREAVVIVREDHPDDKRLVAYVTPDEGRQIDRSQLLQNLKSRLPEYMLPAAIVALKDLPRTPNGKLDRRKLPIPEPISDTANDIALPRTPVEDVVSGLWSVVLGVPSVRIHDNFFDSGGHSLLATQLISRLRDCFKLELPLRTLFENPTVAGLAESVEEALKCARESDQPPLRQVPRDRELPLSFAQQRLWFLNRLELDSAAYNIPIALRLNGRLELGALARAFSEVIRRHEVLRTHFSEENGRPIQVISAAQPVDLAVEDLSALAADGADTVLMMRVAEEANRPFDLSRDPLLRVGLFRLATDHHVLMLVMHHVVSDGWSLGVLVREVASLYDAFTREEPSPFPELSVQYADYAVWEREWLRGEALDRQLAYWKERLAGSTSALELPTDRLRPAVRRSQGSMFRFTVGDQVRAAIMALCRREGTTLFMTLMAAWQSLLYRYTGQLDISVGTPVANRTRRETENLIGFFVNTLVIRTDFSDDPAFIQLLRRVREACLGAYSHQDVPFEKLVEEVEPERDLSRHPLFQVMFILQNSPTTALELRGLRVSPLEVGATASQFDLSLSMANSDAELSGVLEYDTELFDEPTIARLAGHFQNLLGAIAEAPELPILRLSLLSDDERRRELFEWNDTGQDYDAESCIHHLFERQAEENPERVALFFQGRTFTFRELNTRANQLARHLLKLNIGGESRVAVCMPRSPETVAALLAVLKAGGAYVPLDPSYPAERLGFILRDSKAEALLTQEHLAILLPAEGVKTVYLEWDSSWPESESDANPAVEVGADNTAYVIYTSGSTGRPKGVLGLHRGAVNRFQWMWRAYPFDEGEVSAQKTSLSFVDSVWEIFGPLLKGVPALILAEETVGDPRELVRALAEYRVTRIVLVPSLLRVLLNAFVDLGRELPDLMYWVTSGEAVSLDLCRRLKEKMPQCVLINLYGSSEVSADATFYEVGDTARQSSVPIGSPIANTDAFVLDRGLQPAPLGAPGELYIGGAGLARGYLERPELTAERFVPHPFSARAGASLFRTGDMARRLPSGEIEYLGRVDQQIKIRGFRIELGEIEATLLQHPEVREAVVVAAEGKDEDRRLASYIVARRLDRVPTAVELRAFLEAKLPDFMLPSVFVSTENFPHTPSGKVDRRALSSRRLEGVGSSEPFVAPRTRLEETLARVWESALGRERVGVHDNFFEIGGHSLLAAQVMFAVGEAVGFKLPLRALFESPTVSRLAERIEAAEGYRPPEGGGIDSEPPLSPDTSNQFLLALGQAPAMLRSTDGGRRREVQESGRAGRQSQSPRLVLLQPYGVKRPFFCIHPISGDSFCYQELANELGTDRPFYALQARGLGAEAAPHTRVEEMAFDYACEIRLVQPEGPYLVGGWSFGGLVAFEIARQLRSEGLEVAFVALLDTRLPLAGEGENDDDAALLAGILVGLPSIPVDELRGLAADRQLALVLERLKRANAVPRALDAAWFRNYFEVYRANHHAALVYKPKPYPGKVTLFRAADQGSANSDGWHQDWTSLAAAVEVHQVPGSHQDIVKKPHVQALAKRLRSCLES
jgi:amino acid adenylation domain-containing protein